jgi:hypothetical protein
MDGIGEELVATTVAITGFLTSPVYTIPERSCCVPKFPLSCILAEGPIIRTPCLAGSAHL